VIDGDDKKYFDAEMLHDWLSLMMKLEWSISLKCHPHG
jgi:hypothetical protein